jgi:hypothetical protein
MYVRLPGLYRLDLTCTNITPAPPGSGHIVRGCIVRGTKNTWDKKLQTHRNVTVLGQLLEILHFRCFFQNYEIKHEIKNLATRALYEEMSVKIIVVHSLSLGLWRKFQFVIVSHLLTNNNLENKNFEAMSFN